MRRTVIVAVVLGVVLVVLQLVAGNGWAIALLTGLVGAVVAVLVLLVADRLSNRSG